MEASLLLGMQANIAAKPVIAELLAALPSLDHLDCAHVWLLLPPSQCGLHVGVWAAVCMLAIAAMDFGRRYMWAQHWDHTADMGEGAVQTLITDYFERLPQPEHTVSGDNSYVLTRKCARRVALEFWCRLLDFVHECPAPTNWLNSVQADHPFVGVQHGRLVMNAPPGTQLPPDLF